MAKTATLKVSTLASAKRGEARRSAIETAAEALFLDLGFERTTMIAVARRARASKETVYRHFPNKEALFQAVVAETASEMKGRLKLPKGGDLEGALLAFGRDFLTVGTSPRVVKLYRLIIAEGNKFPDLGAIFYSAGPATTQGLLADWLTAASKEGGLSIRDAHEASIAFLSLLFGNFLQRLLIGLDKTVSAAAIEAQAQLAVSQFMHAYRIETAPRKPARR